MEPWYNLCDICMAGYSFSRICVWSPVSIPTSSGTTIVNYKCECEVGAAYGVACRPNRPCLFKDCHLSCPPWTSWSRCIGGFKKRERACQCDWTETGGWIKTLKNGTCTTTRTCGRDPHGPETSWPTDGNKVAIFASITALLLLLAFLIIGLVVWICIQRRRKAAVAVITERTGDPKQTSEPPAYSENTDDVGVSVSTISKSSLESVRQ